MEKLQTLPPAVQDEIDLFDLLDSIWEQRLVVIATIALAALAAAAYAFLATPMYQVQSVLRPAAIKDLDVINIPTSIRSRPRLRSGGLARRWNRMTRG